MPKINIFSTRNTPYARLSNNFRQDIYYRRVRYPTVTNFIYANMLQTPTYRVIMSRARPKSTCTGDEGCETHNRSKAACEAANCTYTTETVHDQFTELYDMEQDNRRKEAIETALNAKLARYPKLAELLLDTGNRPIVYVSRGKWMGTGGDTGEGRNEYGKLLMAARHKLVGERDQRIKTQNEEIREENMYLIYLAYTNLARLIRTSDSLDEYDGLTAPEILDKMKKKGIQVSEIPDKKYIVEEAKRNRYGMGPSAPGGVLKPDMFIAFKKPKVLSVMVNGRYLKEERKRKLRRVHGLILDMYCMYLLGKADQFQDLDPEDYAKATRQQLDTLSINQWRRTTVEIKDLYDKGMLSESLSKKIDAAIVSLNIPSEDETKDAEAMAEAIRKSINDEARPSRVFSRPSGKEVVIWEDDPLLDDPTYKLKGLSPLDDSKIISIGGKIYPSITYYCIAAELADCCIKRRRKGVRVGDALPSEAYMILKEGGRFKRLRPLESDLNRLKMQGYIEKLENNTREALKMKFDERINQNILLSTKDNDLVWDDRRDPILGTQKPQEYNFVGKELMRIRARIRSERKASGDLGDLEEVLSLKVLTNVFQNGFLSGWFNMRVRDMCNVILAMKDYLYVKYDTEQKLTPKFVAAVIDDVYQPCSEIFGRAAEITSPAPDAFIRMIERYKGFLKFVGSDSDVEKVVDIMWKRLAVTIYYLMKHLKTSTSINISVILKKVEMLASLTKNCPKVIPDEKENCIFSAILNIVSGINTLNKRYGYGSGLHQVDFNAAVTILLNLNSLAEQRAMQRKMGGKEGRPDTPPPPPPTARITKDDEMEIRSKLSGAPGYYDEEIITSVIEELKRVGGVPDDDTLRHLAMATKYQEPPGVNDKPLKRPQRRPQRRPKMRKPQNDPLMAAPPVGDPSGDREEDDTEEEEEEEDASFRPDRVISDNIRQAFLAAGVAIEDDDESFAYMVDNAISFVKSYREMNNKTKTNRINFFASPQWGTTVG